MGTYMSTNDLVLFDIYGLNWITFTSIYLSKLVNMRLSFRCTNCTGENLHQDTCVSRYNGGTIQGSLKLL